MNHPKKEHRFIQKKHCIYTRDRQDAGNARQKWAKATYGKGELNRWGEREKRGIGCHSSEGGCGDERRDTIITRCHLVRGAEALWGNQVIGQRRCECKGKIYLTASINSTVAL